MSVGGVAPKDQPARFSAIATAIGPSSPPAGTRARWVSVSPTPAQTTRKPTSTYQAGPPVPGPEVVEPDAPNTSAATIGIVAVTRPTRRYCTTATTRSSAP